MLTIFIQLLSELLLQLIRIPSSKVTHAGRAPAAGNTTHTKAGLARTLLIPGQYMPHTHTSCIHNTCFNTTHHIMHPHHHAHISTHACNTHTHTHTHTLPLLLLLTTTDPYHAQHSHGPHTSPATHTQTQHNTTHLQTQH